MVRKVIQRLAEKIEGVRRAAFWLSIFSLFSQMFAVLRDRLLANKFGADSSLDVYYAAFKVPDLLFVTIASVVSISALVPLFAKKETEGEKFLKSATDSIFSVFAISIGLSSILAYILMPVLIGVAFASFDVMVRQEIIFLSRILLLSPLLLGFSNFFGSIVQYEKRFILYSISPLLYNLGIIFGLVFLTDSFGVIGVGLGVVVGAALHLLLQFGFVATSSLCPKFSFNIDWSVVKETALVSVPRTLALSVSSMLGFFLASVASGLGKGSVAILNLASNLQSVPLSLIGVSFSLAAFPSLSVSAATRNKEEVVLKMSDGLRHIIFWSLSVTFVIVALRAHIVRAVLGSGVFDWQSTRLTAACLAIFVISTVFQSISLFLSRSHYALGKTKAPLLGNIFGGVVSVIAVFIFMSFYVDLASMFNLLADFLDIPDLDAKILLLPISFSLGSIVTAVVLFLALSKEIVMEIWYLIWKTILNSLIAGLVFALTVYFILSISDSFFNLETFIGVVSHAALAFFAGVIVWLLTLFAIKSEELKEVIHRLV